MQHLSKHDEQLMIASHELKSPLAPLALHIEMFEEKLKKGSFSGHEQEESLKRMSSVFKRQLSRMERTINAFLDLSYIQSGHFSLSFERDVDLSQLVKTVIDEYRATSSLIIEETLAENAVGTLDAVKFESVIRNLISNAIRFGKNAPIFISTKLNEKSAKLVVIDQGIGISKEDQTSLFDRKGIGIGLYISKQIVTLHGGTLSVESEIGKGAKFTVELPLFLARAPR